MKPKYLESFLRSSGPSIGRLQTVIVTMSSVFCLSHTAQAAAGNWTGATNGTWATGSNWSLAATPTSADDLTILGPSNVAGVLNINIDAGAAANSLIFTNTAATTLTNTTSGSDQTLTLSSATTALTTGNGAVTIGSTTANQGVNIALGASQTWSIGAGGLTVNNVISGTGFGITKSGAGVLTLAGSNTFTGATSLSAGTLRLTNTGALTGSALTVGGATTLDLRSNTSGTFATGGVTFGTGNTQTFNIAVGNNGSGTAQTLTLGGAVALGGLTTGTHTFNVTGAGTGYTLAMGTFTATSTGNSTVVFNALGANVAFTNFVSSSGGDTALTLGGTGNYAFERITAAIGNRLTNPTVLTSGTVTLAPSTASNSNNNAGTHNFALTVNNGSFVMNYAGYSSTSDLFSNGGTGTTTLVLGGGSISMLSRNGTNSAQNFDALTVNSGSSKISVTNNGNGGYYNFTTATRNAGGTVDLTLPSGTQSATNGILTGSGTASTILTDAGGSAYATVGGSDWAAKAASTNNIVGLSTVSGYTSSTSSALSGNADVAAGVDTTLAGTTTITTLRFNQAEARTIATAGNTLTTGGILVTSTVGANSSTISGGTLRGTSGRDLVVIQNNTSAGLTIGSTIADNTTATALTKSGSGLLTLSNSANSYTGKTFLTGGILNIAADASLGTAPASAVADQLTINGGTLQTAANMTLATNRGITIGLKNATIDTAGSDVSYSGIIVSATASYGSLTKTGAGTLTLAGTNTFSGGAAINAGTILLNNASGLGATATTSGAISFGGGTLQYGSGITTDYSARIAAGTSTGAMRIDTGANNVAFATALTASQSGGLVKSGSGTLSLNNAASVFTGNITIANGTLAAAGSSGTSALGAANAIQLGDSSNNNVTLQLNNWNNLQSTNTVSVVGSGTHTLIGNHNNTGQVHIAGGAITLNSNDLTIRNTNLSGWRIGGGVTGTGNLQFENNNSNGTGNDISVRSALNNTGSITNAGTGNYNLTISGTNSGSIGANVTSLIQNSATSAFDLNAAINSGTAASVEVRAGSMLLNNATSLRVANTVAVGSSGTLDVRQSNTIAGLNNISGSGGSVKNNSGADTVLTVGAASGSYSFAGALADGTTNKLGLTKSGGSTQTLSGTNTYTGATTISGGSLVVNGSITSAVTVNSGGTLGGSGTVGTLTVDSGGNVGPGNSPGVITTGAATFSSGSIFSWELAANLDGDATDSGDTGTRGTSYDGLTTSSGSDLTVASGAIFKILLTGTASLADSFWTTNQEWTDIFSVGSGGATNMASVTQLFNTVQVWSGATQLTPTNGSFSFSGSTLTWSAVPEPTSALAGLLIGAGLLRRRRI